LSLVAQEAEKRLVDLGRVRPGDRVRAVRYHDKPGISEHCGQGVPGCGEGHDPVPGALHDQDRDADPGEVHAEVLAAGQRAAQGRRR
jgi:hypothetical protein